VFLSSYVRIDVLIYLARVFNKLTYLLTNVHFLVQAHLLYIYVKFVHEGHWVKVKVKVTGAKSVSLYPVRG